MRFAMLAAVFVALAAPAFAGTKGEAASKREPLAYVVLKSDASIPFANSTVRGFQVGDDDSLILEAGSRWYRAVVWSSCQRDLKWEHAIALVSTPLDTFDRFSRVLVDGRSCPVVSVDQIENPAKTRADAKAKAKEAADPAS
jgi:hypothetical protein